jgi:predicted GTPase
MWVDLYDFATRVEYLGVGLWPSKTSAPGWDATALGVAMVKVVEDNETSRAMRRIANELRETCQKNQGRRVAARKILEMID